MTSGRRWWTYFRERSPIALMVVIAGSQATSGFYLFRSRFEIGPIVLAALSLAALLVLLRLMDEVKDEAKDRVAHPERPLPRGLLTAGEVRRAIVGLGFVLMAWAVYIAVLPRKPIVAGLYALAVVYAFLMYHEFFVPNLLAKSVWFYTATHQIIVVPMYLFAVGMSSPGSALSARAMWFALTGLGASFVVEVCRKLDPAAHPILGTYLRVYGRNQVTVAVIAGLALLSVSADRIGVLAIVLPFALLVAATLPLLYSRPDRYKVIEGASGLLALVQMLALTIHHFSTSWR